MSRLLTTQLQVSRSIKLRDLLRLSPANLTGLSPAALTTCCACHAANLSAAACKACTDKWHVVCTGITRSQNLQYQQTAVAYRLQGRVHICSFCKHSACGLCENNADRTRHSWFCISTYLLRCFEPPSLKIKQHRLNHLNWLEMVRRGARRHSIL